MYYILYLSSLCHRRRWPDPLYEFMPAYGNKGYTCTVRVNHRIYKVGTVHETEEFAREAAAMHAYLIVRSLSHSEQQQQQQQQQAAYAPPIMQTMGTTAGGWGARRNS